MEHQGRKSCFTKKQSGFSVMEVIVSMAIMTMFASLVLVNQNGLNNRTNTDSIAHQIALWIREAQVTSMGVRLTSAGDGNFAVGFGVHFDMANPNRFIYFADRNNDGVYVPANGDTVEQTIRLLQGYRITSLCGGHSGTGASVCNGINGLTDLNFLDVSFRRPNPDANIRSQFIGGADVYSPARVTITSPKGITRTVVVFATGQVSVR